jgi:VWFA-related protein
MWKMPYRSKGDYTMRMNLLGGILLVSALAAVPCLQPWVAGAPQAGQQPGPTIRVGVNLVNLFATVRDKKTKRIVPDLEQKDFKITEDNAPQTISFFSRDSTLPITLGLLLDTSGSEQFMLPAEQDAAIRFLSTVMRKNDLAMLMTFDSDADLLADFTDDRDILSRAIHRARINTPGAQGPLAADLPGTILYDAIYLACHEKLADEAGRKALVIMTDAMDEGSKDSIQDAIEAAQRTDTVIHVLLVGDPQHFSVNESAAKKLTDETGGRTIVVSSEKKLEDAFQQISEELRNQYTLGYYPTNTAHDGSYRKIKVDATSKDIDVLTRKGYYAPKN